MKLIRPRRDLNLHTDPTIARLAKLRGLSGKCFDVSFKDHSVLNQIRCTHYIRYNGFSATWDLGYYFCVLQSLLWVITRRHDCFFVHKSDFLYRRRNINRGGFGTTSYKQDNERTRQFLWHIFTLSVLMQLNRPTVLLLLSFILR